MNLEEAHKLLTVIRAAYPNVNKDGHFDESIFALQRKLWMNAFVDVEFEEVFTALSVWISTEIFPPQIVELKRIILRNRQPESVISPQSAWEIVDKAVRRYGSYNQDKAFETFSEPIKRAVRNVGGWQKICSTELGQSWDFLRKNFISVYEEIEQEDQERLLLPTNVVDRLLEMAEKDRARL